MPPNPRRRPLFLLLALAIASSVAPFASADSEAGTDADAPSAPGGPRATLNNGRRLPLIGTGVGNLKHELLPGVVER
eukprot:CAMPEP_0183302224 /NCGR_PEP_ID=MMETSP0160_2-20130417/8091_1 /TAXON_ID=2839 ORGANISM="Odontella Sinensis, Strain Grunow 1884" /NCGR_SAMPLE_ID=MMETSP0160_2 /ASSEMBLY_ACC=CAM_ASM_000250 /LENGTH=76 /DNA_ID=CAMNT_0025464969 /DNA_START=81 /DNA_END=308 /DNA_ORIENTATION=-